PDHRREYEIGLKVRTKIFKISASFMSRYQIRRDDGISDGIAGQIFDSYDAAYAVLERYYADVCCSDDREYYRINDVDA
ncbi:MAG: hypothetical protein O2839_09355, partial [Cyanobacteria bacterium]|nr:hypothetical protein [Cyanobacteriota bacterium]